MAKFKGHVIFTKAIDFEFDAKDKFDANEKMRDLDYEIATHIYEKVAYDSNYLRNNVNISNESFHYEFVPIRENIDQKEKK